MVKKFCFLQYRSTDVLVSPTTTKKHSSCNINSGRTSQFDSNNVYTIIKTISLKSMKQCLQAEFCLIKQMALLLHVKKPNTLQVLHFNT